MITAGYFLDVHNSQHSAKCKACPANKAQFQDEEGKTSCKSCQPGFINRDEHLQGMSQAVGACEECDSGRFQYEASIQPTQLVPNPTNPTDCSDCPAGFEYKSDVDRSKDQCKFCVAGKYQSDNDVPATTCKFCVAGSVFLQKDKDCVDCISGKYQPHADSATPSCQICPGKKKV